MAKRGGKFVSFEVLILLIILLVIMGVITYYFINNVLSVVPR